MANYPFPNMKLELGSTGRFVSDIQRELNIAVTGVYDFLTMAAVAVHKFQNGLNHNDPTVGAETWNSIFNRNGGGENAGANDRRNNTTNNGTPAAPGEREGVGRVGQINRTNDEPTNEGNPAATTTGNTNATDENTPAAAVTDDTPREDQPTVTAAEQQAAGGPAGGVAAAPTDENTNTAAAPAAEAGQTSANGDQARP